jgi:hypothetical protein
MFVRFDASNFGIIPTTKMSRPIDRDDRDGEHHLERLADADQVDADEDGVAGQVHRPAGGDPEDVQRLDVAADEDDDRRGGDGVLDEDRRSRQEAAPGPHRPAGEGVAAARGRQGRRELGEREHHRRVHDPHQDRGDEQPAPAALGQAEVPAAKSPEMTYATPSPARRTQPAAPLRSWRLSR